MFLKLDPFTVFFVITTLKYMYVTPFQFGVLIRPDFFYFLVLGSADPIFLKTRIKIKVTLICFIFIFSADLNFPPQNEIKVG